MQKISVLLLLFFSFQAAQSQDFSLYQEKEFTGKNGTTLPYRILYPENYDPSRKYPLVLLLHGGGERGNDNGKQLTHGAKLFLQPENRSRYPCIVVAPQCPENSYWASVKFERTKYPLELDFNYKYPVTPPLESAVELVRQIIKEKKADKKRIYIAGLSMGGMGTLEAVYRNPRLFSAAAAICGGGDVKTYSKKAAKTRFWLFHGDVDGVIPVKHSREMLARLQELKADVKYSEYPGVNHNSWENAFAEPGFLDWMFSLTTKTTKITGDKK